MISWSHSDLKHFKNYLRCKPFLQCWGSGFGSWDPYVYGPPRSIRLRILLSSSKYSKQNLDSYCLWLLFYFLSLKNDVNVPSKRNKQKNLEKNYRSFLLASWRSMTKIAGSVSISRGMDPRIRIRPKMSRIRNTASQTCVLNIHVFRCRVYSRRCGWGPSLATSTFTRRWRSGSAASTPFGSRTPSSPLCKFSRSLSVSVADPDHGSGAFLTPGSGIGFSGIGFFRISSRIPNPYLWERHFFG